MLRGLFETPSPEALLAFLKEHLRAGDTLVQVAGEYEVYYHGRAVLVSERFNPAEVVRIVFLEPALALALTLREAAASC